MPLYSTEPTPGDTSRFTHDRFGMFLHFGLYSLPARDEWLKSMQCMSEESYDRYFQNFNPDMFDAREWARSAKAAGMKYAVLTAKHHEGFCLFDSKYTDYKSTNTPFGRDIIREYTDAFRAEDLGVGLYYSLLDWHHPDFTIDRNHPRRNDADAFEQNRDRDMKKYAEYMRNQLRELLTNYGKIDILWLDFSYDNDEPPYSEIEWMKGKGKDDWESEKLIALVRELQPNIIINNRADIIQDIWSPEQFQPHTWITNPKTGNRVVWEACHTFSGSWGYNRDQTDWKSPKMLLDMLVETVSCGGNFIMNVGPNARGCFDKRAEAALSAYADWMSYNSRSIYGCTQAEAGISAEQGCLLTQSDDGKRLYIHLLKYPFQKVTVKGISDRITYAQFLHDGSELIYGKNSLWGVVNKDFNTADDDALTINIPVVKPDIINPVIEIMLK